MAERGKIQPIDLLAEHLERMIAMADGRCDISFSEISRAREALWAHKQSKKVREKGKTLCEVFEEEAKQKYTVPDDMGERVLAAGLKMHGVWKKGRHES